MSDERPKIPPVAEADDAASGDLGFETGSLIGGRYELLATLGRGGMGSVYSVRDRELDEVVALKVLHRDLIGSADILGRFRQEVKLARRVTHTNVARTYDIGEHQGARFLTMELVEGESLADLLTASGPLPVERALNIAGQMCAGMVAAHDAGVIHRDLKPENVCIGSDGRVVVMDFGIARAPLPADARQTGGGMLGTPAYMAPEQVSGESAIDARADIYAFGAVLYEMVTGVIAWPGSSAFAVAAARLSTPPPDPRLIRQDLATPVAELILRCMARDADDRFSDVRALLEALEGLSRITGPLSSSRAEPPRPLEVQATLPAGGQSDTQPSARVRAGDRFTRTSGADGLRDDIANQLVLMGGGSPPYRRILELLDQLLAQPGSPLQRSFAQAWQKRSFDGPYERPLLVLATLRLDALVEGRSHPLFEAIAAPAPKASSVTSAALSAALAPERIGFWITLRSRRVQTNEVSRAIAWAWPAILAGCADGRRPLALVDVGASAGLNLAADLLPLSWRRRTLGVITPPTAIDVRARAGFDPRPLDVRKREDRDWLMACVWPGQPERATRLNAAIGAFQRASPAPELTMMRASAVPARLPELSKLVGPRGLVLVYQTLIRGYVAAPERDDFENAMQAWLRSGVRGRRAWSTLELEDSADPAFGCPIDVHVAAGGDVASIRLGRTSYHPDVIDVEPDAERRLTELLA